MKTFAGFPKLMDFTPIPTIFFSTIMPEIEDVLELKVLLATVAILYHRKGYPKYIGLSELEADPLLVANLKNKGRDYLKGCVDRAVQNNILIEVLAKDGEPVYLLNTEANRHVIDKIGEIRTPDFILKNPTAEAGLEDDIFTLYEENIGLLTPIVCDELAAAEKIYPRAWIKEAIAEAVSLNKRNWRYISRILENWATQGKDGTTKRDPKEDRDKYTRGKYGHTVKS